MRSLVLTVLLLLVAVPGIAQKVYIDYDEKADFGRFKTFAWGKTKETSLAESNPLMHSRMKNGLEHYLTQGGMTEVESDPDLYVTYHTSTKDRLQVNTTDWGYGYGSYWRWDPYWGGGYNTTSASTYTEGTLVIDIWEARQKTLIWRGTATGTVPQNPEKVARRIDKTLAKMAKKWDKMYDGS